MSRRASIFSVLLLSCTGGGSGRGTDTGNPPVIDLQTSACRERYGETKAIDGVRQGLAPAITSDPLYDGLTCFVWERGADDRLTISLTNYETGCHADSGWSPKVEVAEDGALELVLEDDECIAAACGWCIYDISFTTQATDLLRDREVRLYERGCDTSARVKTAMLPLGSEPRGAVCTYMHYQALKESRTLEPGPRSLCQSSQAGDAGVSCPDGYECTDLDANEDGDFSKDERCLASCATDSDCDALSRCEAGVCELRRTGLTTR